MQALCVCLCVPVPLIISPPMHQQRISFCSHSLVLHLSCRTAFVYLSASLPLSLDHEESAGARGWESRAGASEDAREGERKSERGISDFRFASLLAVTAHTQTLAVHSHTGWQTGRQEGPADCFEDRKAGEREGERVKSDRTRDKERDCKEGRRGSAGRLVCLCVCERVSECERAKGPLEPRNQNRESGGTGRRSKSRSGFAGGTRRLTCTHTQAVCLSGSRVQTKAN